MKICDVVKNSIWYDPRVKKQIESYVSNNVDLVCVGVIEPRYDAKEVAKIKCEVQIVENSKKYYNSKRTIFTKIKRELSTNRGIYKKIIEANPDIIHANDLNALIPAYKAAKKLKCKLIYDTHEIFLENPWIANNKIVKLVWGFYEKYIIKRVDAVICVSHAAANYFVNKYKVPQPIVVTNSISLKQIIKNGPEKVSPKQILNHGQFYVGRGYDIMIETAPLLKNQSDIQLVLRGFGPMEQQLKERAKELKAENVYFAPPVKVEELIPMASHAYIGLAITESISLNFKLSVSNKIFEYCAAGLPVIMSDIPEHRYLNDKYNFGIILPSDSPEELVKAILTINNDDTIYRTYSENARRLSSEVNWENDFNKLLELEKRIIESI